MIRQIAESDYLQVKRIHEKFYEKEFDYPEFVKNYLAAFVVVDDRDQNSIIVAGGIRTILESVLVTNKEYTVRERRSALYAVLEASVWLSHNSGYDQLHAFISDDAWYHQLKRVGFKDCKGKALVLGV